MKKGGKIKRLGKRARSALEDEFSPELKHLRESGKHSLDRVRDVGHRIDQYVHEYPMGAMIVSAAIGALVALALRHRRRYY